MNELQAVENRREVFRKYSIGGILGLLGSIFVSEAKAQDGGGYAAAKATADLILVLKGYIKDFNDFKQEARKATDKNSQHIDDQYQAVNAIQGVTNTVDSFFRRFRNFGNKIDRLPADMERFARSQFKEIEDLSSKYEKVPKGQKNNRNMIAAQASTRAGHSFAVVAAKNTRSRYGELGEHLEKSELPSKDRSKAELYTASMGPIMAEQFQLLLESNLRIEKQNERIIEILGGSAVQPKDRKPYGSTELRTDFENFKNGGGTLPSSED